jgi:hypothetical protein
VNTHVLRSTENSKPPSFRGRKRAVNAAKCSGSKENSPSAVFTSRLLETRICRADGGRMSGSQPRSNTPSRRASSTVAHLLATTSLQLLSDSKAARQTTSDWRTGLTRSRSEKSAINCRQDLSNHCFHAAAWARTGESKPLRVTSPRSSNERPLPRHSSAIAFETRICSGCA